MRIWIMLMVKTRICVTSVQPLFSYTWPTCQFFSTVWIRSKINYLSLSIYINRRTRYIWKRINWSDKSCKSCTNQNIQIYHYSNMHLICGIELNETKMKKTNLHNRKMDWFMVIAILFCTHEFRFLVFWHSLLQINRFTWNWAPGSNKKELCTRNIWCTGKNPFRYHTNCRKDIK